MFASSVARRLVLTVPGGVVVKWRKRMKPKDLRKKLKVRRMNLKDDYVDFYKCSAVFSSVVGVSKHEIRNSKFDIMDCVGYDMKSQVLRKIYGETFESIQEALHEALACDDACGIRERIWAVLKDMDNMYRGESEDV